MRTGVSGGVAAAVAVVGVVGIAGVPALGDVQMPPQFSNGMVLQQGTQARVWGHARPGERVVVTGNWSAKDASGAVVEAVGEAVTDIGGWWGMTIPTPRASELKGGALSTVTITVQGDNTITLSDVLIGEVWLASGQSNMEWSVAASGDAEAVTKAAGRSGTKVRFYQVENAISLHKRSEAVGKWVESSPATAPGLSAVALNFAEAVSEKLGVAVGIVQSDWGGTPVQAWMSKEALAAFPQYAAALKEQETLRDPTTRMSLMGDMEAKWWAGLDKLRGGAGDSWMKPEFDDASWDTVKMPAHFAGDLARFDGVVYLRRVVELPADASGEEGMVELGPIDDRDEAYVNGVLVGGMRADNQWSVARKYTIPEGVLKPGKNVVAVRVLDTGGLGGFGGKAEEMQLSCGGKAKSISLAGDWKQKAGAAKGDWPEMGRAPNIGPNSPTTLYNAMIAPLAPMSLAGVIWYQGESNVGAAEDYEALFKAMIADWRGAFTTSDLPVGFVQIAPFEYTRFSGIQTRTRMPDKTARLREAQAHTLALQRTGMAVTLDVGDAADIHPRDKKTVGQRLAWWALGEVYGRSDGGYVTRSPAFKSASFDGGAATVTIDDGGSGLIAGGKATDDAVPGFVLAGEDKRFVPATGRIDGNRVVVTAPGVTKAVAVRYAWDQAPTATLRGKNGLPVAPFRSDSWAWGEYTTAMSDVRELRTKEAGFVELFNGKDLSGWANINTAPSTWSVKAAGTVVGSEEPVIACTGHPTGLLRTEKMYENFVLEVEWRHLESGGNAGLFVWSDALTARGQPFTRAVEVQVMDGAEGEWYTSDGDIFPIHGAVMTPENGRQGSSRAYPTERRMRTSPEWNHYRLECNNGDISLAVNGKVVTKGKAASPRKGYICLESEGSEVEFRAIRVKELPASSGLKPEQVAMEAAGFVPLYNGVDFSGWKFTDEHKGHWKADDWTIDFDGQGPEASDLWSEKSYRDFVLVCDWRWTAAGTKTARPVILASGLYGKGADGKDKTVEVMDAGDSGIYLRGSSKSQVNAWCWPIGSGEVYGYRTDESQPPEVRAGVTPKEVADAPIGQWNRFVITMKGELLTVELNGKTVIKEAKLPGVAPEGPIALQMHGSPIQWGNIYIKELK